MSTCEIRVFRDGKASETFEFDNSFGGAARIWTSLFNRHCKNPDKPYDNWMSRPASDRQLWDLSKDASLPRSVRATLVATFDQAIVNREHFAQFSADLLAFDAAYSMGLDFVSHLSGWASQISKLAEDGGVEAIGFRMTSVSEDLWILPPEEEDADDWQPYDLRVQTKHFEVYEWLDAYDASVTEKAAP